MTLRQWATRLGSSILGQIRREWWDMGGLAPTSVLLKGWGTRYRSGDMVDDRPSWAARMSLSETR